MPYITGIFMHATHYLALSATIAVYQCYGAISNSLIHIRTEFISSLLTKSLPEWFFYYL